MTHNPTITTCILLISVAATAACSSSDPADSPFSDPTTGGSTSSGGFGTGGEVAQTGGQLATGGQVPAAGSTGTGLGFGEQSGSGTTTAQYMTRPVNRSLVPYALITNGWGPGFVSHEIAWNGTAFTVVSTQGSSGSRGEPASYPSVFCGKYSVDRVPDCGLPAAIDSLTSVRTGWKWEPNGNTGEYNAAYDIWVGDGDRLQGYLMVWFRDPPVNRPAGSLDSSNQNITVENVPGVWDIWRGSVNGLPIINWVRPSGQESYELEFDVLDFLRDAEARGLTYPGTHINSVAVGFEIWEGPITNLESVDFYVDVQ